MQSSSGDFTTFNFRLSSLGKALCDMGEIQVKFMNISTEHILQCNQSEPLADASRRIVDQMNENRSTVVGNAINKHFLNTLKRYSPLFIICGTRGPQNTIVALGYSTITLRQTHSHQTLAIVQTS